MSIKNQTKVALVAVVMATGLAGCGDDDGGGGGSQASSPSSPAEVATTGTTATTPGTQPSITANPGDALKGQPVDQKDGRWAEQLCTAMSGRVSAIKPPQVDTTSADATLKSLRTFFGDVIKEQGGQLKTLKEVGPPPGSKAKSAWTKTVSELEDVRGDMTDVKTELDETSADSAEEIQGVIDGLQKKLASLSSYGGPVAALGTNEDIGAALQNEPACDRVL